MSNEIRTQYEYWFFLLPHVAFLNYMFVLYIYGVNWLASATL